MIYKLLLTTTCLLLIILLGCFFFIRSGSSVAVSIPKQIDPAPTLEIKAEENKTAENKTEKNKTVSTAWQPAVFKGIRIGRDSRETAKKIFGEPSWSGKPEDQDERNPEIWDDYKNLDELNKHITVMSSAKTGTILLIVSHHDDLTMEEAIKIFGNDFVKASYSLVRCNKNKDEFRMAEDPQGEITFIEYRNKGVIIIPNSYNGKVQDIEYRPFSGHEDNRLSCY